MVTWNHRASCASSSKARWARAPISDIRIRNYKDIQGFEVPTEFLVLRNGRPFWREQYADVRVNEEFVTGTFDQAKWYDIPIPK